MQPFDGKGGAERQDHVSVERSPRATGSETTGRGIARQLSVKPGELRVRIGDAVFEEGMLRGRFEADGHHVSWDLRYEPSKEIRLRTSPAYAPEIRVGDEGWRPLPEGGRLSLLAPPGTYTVKLTAGGQEVTAPLSVLKDPNSAGSEADIQKQTEMSVEIRKDLESAAEMVNAVEVIRAQLHDLSALLRGDTNAAPARSAAEDLDKKLVNLEDSLIQRNLTGRGQDGVRWPVQLVSKLAYLANGVASSDFPPTSQHAEVQALLRQRLRAYRQQFDELVARDVAALNNQLRERKITNVITRVP